jgi:hypothetical protein
MYAKLPLLVVPPCAPNGQETTTRSSVLSVAAGDPEADGIKLLPVFPAHILYAGLLDLITQNLAVPPDGIHVATPAYCGTVPLLE